MINRRELLQGSTVTILTAGVIGISAKEALQVDIIDTNLSLFQWPLRRLPLDDTSLLIKKIRALGITQGWAGSLEAILHRDLSSVNGRLATECANYPELIPVGSINPTLPGWREDLSRCFREHKMPGIRLHPSYHGYTLANRTFAQVLEQATKAGLFVQIAVTMEDPRTQHLLMRVPDVDLTPLPRLMRDHPGARVQLLNLRPRAAQIDSLSKIPNIYLDTARMEGTDGVPTLLEKMPHGRVLFGTHAPLLIPEAALIRTHESNRLNEKALRSLFTGNAQKLLKA
tara:strand:- start:482 stop:1336 length:855 start_codon:yes stop_codon:yes gene_type:complete